jgi:FKBP-type peptidyl-prolyl cis-trans isomerase 2
MKKLLILILAATILLSGCVDKTVQTVKNGDNISVDYVGSFQDGKVFDTSIESVAKANNLSNPNAQYEPLNFTVGKRSVIEGFDEGVIGMKVGDTRTLTIPPEKGYPVDPSRIQVSPIIQEIPATSVIPRVLEVPTSQFEQVFGPNHSVGDTVTIPDTNINVTITNMTPEISLKYNLIVGSNIWDSRAPWNETVIKIDDKNITVKPKITKNEIIQFQGAPFNTTVIDVNDTNITLRNNRIPDKRITVPGMFGQMVDMKISFNETSIIMDQNSEVAGKTLIFNVTLRSIDK